MSRIDFIGIGAPKCGTTWFSAQFEAHPQIGFAPDKEVYYFADTILRRWLWIRGVVDGRSTGARKHSPIGWLIP